MKSGLLNLLDIFRCTQIVNNKLLLGLLYEIHMPLCNCFT